ncbi:mitochondrial carrier domain-containing protein [Schizophyllum amplum]|uniref:Mitochondrial carrier domain-containing protein n=1 Tax=Schizophyllum amplum TaxID=97359 RepID=A0A550CHU8_9AGAR|nr:mitochondrial carrier domain-containing protein [Auriculariopsis ampla]
MSTQSKPVKPVQLTPFASALAGALGACFSTAVVYPLDVAKTRIQALPSDGPKTKADVSMLRVLLRVYKSEGIMGWYRGFAATMINTFSMQYAYFFFYAFVRSSYIARLRRSAPKGAALPPLSTAAELLLGAVAGALAQIFTIPVSVIATRQQVGPPNRLRSGASTPRSLVDPETGASKDEDTFLSVAREIVEEEGVSGLWLGLRPGLVLTVNPAITYGMYERVKSLLLLAKEKAGKGASASMSPLQSFGVGALSKTLATVVTYPYIMAKVRIQARSADAEEAAAEHRDAPRPHMQHHQDHSRHVGALDILKRVYKREGLPGWYQGMQSQITKAVLSQALLFLTKEQFEKWAVAIILLLSGLLR